MLQSKLRKIPLLVVHYLTKFDDLMYSSFRVIPKIRSINLRNRDGEIYLYVPDFYGAQYYLSA